MIPRFERTFSFWRQLQFWLGREYHPQKGEYLLDHARSGIVLSLKACLPKGGRVGVMAYNCEAVMSAIVYGNCIPVFIDVTNDFKLDYNGLKTKEIDAIIVTNLFGIQNDIGLIRQSLPGIPIIIDNAQGYGLPIQGDFTVYSINQGKYPSLGDGGILYCTNEEDDRKIKQMYMSLTNYSIFRQFKLYIRLVKAVIYSKWLYSRIGSMFSKKEAWGKRSSSNSLISISQMCKGVSRMYQAWVKDNQGKKLKKQYVDIVYTDCPSNVIKEYASQGIEVGTIFQQWPEAAIKYGYNRGDCPMAEYLTEHVVMVPNYFKKQI